MTLAQDGTGKCIIVYPSILDSSTCSANIWFKRPVWGRGRIRGWKGKAESNGKQQSKHTFRSWPFLTHGNFEFALLHNVKVVSLVAYQAYHGFVWLSIQIHSVVECTALWIQPPNHLQWWASSQPWRTPARAVQTLKEQEFFTGNICSFLPHSLKINKPSEWELRKFWAASARNSQNGHCMDTACPSTSLQWALGSFPPSSGKPRGSHWSSAPCRWVHSSSLESMKNT